MNVPRWKEILSSPRFWQLTVAAIAQLLQHYGVIDSFVANTLTAWLASVALVGSADSVAMKIGSATEK